MLTYRDVVPGPVLENPPQGARDVLVVDHAAVEHVEGDDLRGRGDARQDRGSPRPVARVISLPVRGSDVHSSDDLAALAWLGAGAEFRSGVVDARVEQGNRSARAVVPRGGRVADLLDPVAPLSSAAPPAGDPASEDRGHCG